MVTIIHAKSYADVAYAKRLFVELATHLDFAVLFQGVQAELEDIPHAYTPPEGCLHFAVVDMRVVGCSVVKRIDESTCELKRLYVLPPFRRRGIGTTLAATAVREAAHLGYTTMQLATLPSMKHALSIYNALGFKVAEPAGSGSPTKAINMELSLKGDDACA